MRIGARAGGWVEAEIHSWLLIRIEQHRANMSSGDGPALGFEAEVGRGSTVSSAPVVSSRHGTSLSIERQHPDETGDPLRLGAGQIIRNIDQRHDKARPNGNRGAIGSRNFIWGLLRGVPRHRLAVHGSLVLLAGRAGSASLDREVRRMLAPGEE